MLNPANTVGTVGHTVFNLGASYSAVLAGHATTVRATVNNLANRHYWEYRYVNWIKPADPRSFGLVAQIDF